MIEDKRLASSFFFPDGFHTVPEVFSFYSLLRRTFSQLQFSVLHPSRRTVR